MEFIWFNDILKGTCRKISEYKTIKLTIYLQPVWFWVLERERLRNGYSVSLRVKVWANRLHCGLCSKMLVCTPLMFSSVFLSKTYGIAFFRPTWVEIARFNLVIWQHCDSRYCLSPNVDSENTVRLQGFGNFWINMFVSRLLFLLFQMELIVSKEEDESVGFIDFSWWK